MGEQNGTKLPRALNVSLRRVTFTLGKKKWRRVMVVYKAVLSGR